MKFKKGDLLLCIDDTDHDFIVKGRIYTAEADSSNNGVTIKEGSLGAYNYRFVLANDISALERIIYGVQ